MKVFPLLLLVFLELGLGTVKKTGGASVDQTKKYEAEVRKRLDELTMFPKRPFGGEGWNCLEQFECRSPLKCKNNSCKY